MAVNPFELNIKTFDEIKATVEEKLIEQGSAITNRNPGGAFDLLIRVLCLIVSDLYTLLAQSFEMSFPDTATGSFLDLHAKAVGIARNPATKARKEFRLVRDNTTGVLQVEIGDTLKTPVLPTRGQLIFKTIASTVAGLETKAGEFADGVGEIYLLLEADDAGTDYNDMEVLLNPSNPVPVEMEIDSGFTGVDNVYSTGEDTEPGTNLETDDELRLRIAGRWTEIADSATVQSYINFAKGASPIIKDANAFKGTNATDVSIVVSGSPGSRDLSASIGINSEADDNFAPAYTVDGTPGGTPCPFGNEIHSYIRARAPMTDIIDVRSVIEVPTDISINISVLSGFNIADVSEILKTRIRAFFLVERTVDDVFVLKVAQSLKWSELNRVITDTEGVDEYKFISPAALVSQDNIDTDANKVLSLGVIAIGSL